MSHERTGYSFYTIGHSTRPISEFVALLVSAEVTLVADVRIAPHSRANPQYDHDALARALQEFQIGYEHIAKLGGLRRKSPNVPPDINAFWQNGSFHNYADYAMTPSFREGLARLLELGRDRRCAVMCSEALWWRCHRRIIADYLIAAGKPVFHLVGVGRLEAAKMTPHARPNSSGALTYPLEA